MIRLRISAIVIALFISLASANQALAISSSIGPIGQVGLNYYAVLQANLGSPFGPSFTADPPNPQATETGEAEVSIGGWLYYSCTHLFGDSNETVDFKLMTFTLWFGDAELYDSWTIPTNPTLTCDDANYIAWTKDLSLLPNDYILTVDVWVKGQHETGGDHYLFLDKLLEFTVEEQEEP